MLEEIKAKREIMIKCANKYGFTNEQTIKYSQELDELINVYPHWSGKAIIAEKLLMLLIQATD
jgi:stage 0 sporulation regulatory protein